MKNFILISLMCTFYIVLFESCSDNDVENEGSFFTAQIDGQPVAIKGDLFAYAIDLTSNFNVYGIIDIDNQKSIYIQLPLGPTMGRHTFSDEVYAYLIDGEKSYSTLVGEGTGFITIDSIDGTRFTGTFEFEAFDFDNPETSLSVINGRFDVIKR